MANTEAYVVDRFARLVPVGVVGELLPGGARVARGYLKQAELTAEKFVAHPLRDDRNAKVYRTGDLVAGCRTATLSSSAAPTTRSSCAGSALNSAKSRRCCCGTKQSKRRWWWFARTCRGPPAGRLLHLRSRHPDRPGGAAELVPAEPSGIHAARGLRGDGLVAANAEREDRPAALPAPGFRQELGDRYIPRARPRKSGSPTRGPPCSEWNTSVFTTISSSSAVTPCWLSGQPT